MNTGVPNRTLVLFRNRVPLVHVLPRYYGQMTMGYSTPFLTPVWGRREYPLVLSGMNGSMWGNARTVPGQEVPSPPVTFPQLPGNILSIFDNTFYHKIFMHIFRNAILLVRLAFHDAVGEKGADGCLSFSLHRNPNAGSIH